MIGLFRKQARATARQAARKRDASVKSPEDQLASSTGPSWPVRRYGNSQGDGIAADRTACGATSPE
jgi:hypothetical protein